MGTVSSCDYLTAGVNMMLDLKDIRAVVSRCSRNPSTSVWSMTIIGEGDNEGQAAFVSIPQEQMPTNDKDLYKLASSIAERVPDELKPIRQSQGTDQ